MAIRMTGHNTIQSTINITPMVDTALTLLLVFMVLAPFLQRGMPVHLPEASAPTLKQTKGDVILTIQKGGNIYLGEDKMPIPMDELQGRLATIFSVKQSKDLFLKADTALLYGTVVKVMSIAKKAGVDRIGMITQPEIESSSP